MRIGFQQAFPPEMAKGNDALERLRQAREGGTEARLNAMTQEFEGLLLEQMVREMRKTIPESTLWEHQAGKELFDEMLDGEFVRRMTERGGIGIAEMMRHQIEPATAKPTVNSGETAGEKAANGGQTQGAQAPLDQRFPGGIPR